MSQQANLAYSDPHVDDQQFRAVFGMTRSQWRAMNGRYSTEEAVLASKMPCPWLRKSRTDLRSAAWPVVVTESLSLN